MLTIKNYNTIQRMEFSSVGRRWMLMSVVEYSTFYNLLILPMVEGVFSLSDIIFIRLWRNSAGDKYPLTKKADVGGYHISSPYDVSLKDISHPRLLMDSLSPLLNEIKI